MPTSGGTIRRYESAIAPGAVVTNAIGGDALDTLVAPSVVRVYASQDGAGVPNAQVTLQLGTDTKFKDFQPNQAAVANNINKDQDELGAGIGVPGDKIQLQLRNADAAANVNVAVLVEITPLQ